MFLTVREQHTAIDAFLVWEYVSTLPMELRIWRSHFTLFNVVFGLLRYITLAQAAVLTYFNYWVGAVHPSGTLTLQSESRVTRPGVPDTLSERNPSGGDAFH